MPTPKTGEKHTPGPLEVSVTQNGLGGVLLWPDTSKGGVWKRRLDEGCDGVFSIEVAHVLAAAPDLLQALQEILAVAPKGSILAKTLGVNAGLLDKARAAVNKATGQEGR